MAGKIGGVLALAALVAGLLLLATPGEAAEEECGPVTLAMLFPSLDVEGNPLPTTTVPTTDETTTTTTEGETSTTSSETPTTAVPTTTDFGPQPVCRSWVYDMGWPIGIESHVFSGFGADRDDGTRRHKGNDILAPKLAPVLAVADGTVTAVHDTPPDDCCWLLLTHDDGWQSLYVHLNNDTYQTDDGLGHGVRPGIVVGTRVEAGQVIGWVGDSGNAEGTVPHLHFELRHPDGYSVDPYSSLKAAKEDLDLPSVRTPYIDLEGMAFGVRASSLLTEGFFWPCDDVGLEFCPTKLASAEDVSDLVSLMTGLPAPLLAERTQLIRLQASIPEYQLPFVLGCETLEDCLQRGITEADVARIALWANLALRGADPPELDITSDLRLTDTTTAEMGLRTLGRIRICDPVVDDKRLITRSETATLLMWWVLGEGQVSCVESGDPTS